jgi:hypothetical protein
MDVHILPPLAVNSKTEPKSTHCHCWDSILQPSTHQCHGAYAHNLIFFLKSLTWSLSPVLFAGPCCIPQKMEAAFPAVHPDVVQLFETETNIIITYQPKIWH